MDEPEVLAVDRPPVHKTSTRLLRGARKSLAILLPLFIGVGLWIWSVLSGSLPQVAGTITTQGNVAPIRIDRDAQGIPTIHAEGWNDLAFGLGFVHGQDRFFEMDLLRRKAAGELAELFGAGPDDKIVDLDRDMRKHRFRAIAKQVVDRLNHTDRTYLGAYVQGVNQGLTGLTCSPFEYSLVGGTPRRWVAEDSILVILSMFVQLQADEYLKESALGVVHDTLPASLAAFLSSPGSELDSPMEGGPLAMAPIPPETDLDLRKRKPAEGAAKPVSVWTLFYLEPDTGGSNNWAVGPKRTASGVPLVANDMHLPLGLPTIWYRASLDWPAASPATESATTRTAPRRVATGATLPGAPAIVVGSNGDVAWGFTNSEADWSDLIILEQPPGDDSHYLTPDGPQAFETHLETIAVKGEGPREEQILWTRWGPVVDRDHLGRRRAMRWVAHDPEAINLDLVRMLDVRSAAEALDLANRCGIPQQNLVVADRQGQIGWTIVGRIPRRMGTDGRTPASWADGECRWDGYYPPEAAPRIVNPERGFVWTANARVVGGKALAKLGFGGYDKGARGAQIRDGLQALPSATEADLLQIQLDDRALFLEHRWHHLLLELLAPAAIAQSPGRAELKTAAENWGGRAAVDSVGYRLVCEFRLRVIHHLLSVLTGPCQEADPRFNIRLLPQLEGVAWQLVSQRPAHLLPPGYKSWDRFLLAMADGLSPNGDASRPLAGRTWGKLNTVRVRHPLSQAVPLLSYWLDMPARELPGGWADVPRIQRPRFGASQRMVVGPGREKEGIFHMPGGQSGHPLSPHYGDGQQDWEEGNPSAFLPGESQFTLTLRPGR